MAVLKQWGAKLLDYEGGYPGYVLSSHWDEMLSSFLKLLISLCRQFLLCLAVRDCSGTIGGSWSGARLRCVCCVCRQVSVHT